jgi:hypothetical protein
MRITDIITALRDRRFELVEQKDLSQPGPDGAVVVEEHLLHARRAEGPDQMHILVVVQGRRHQIERQVSLPGGHRYRAQMESGELKIFLHGELPRDSRRLTHEMNALHLALRERFDRLPAKR